MEVGADHVVDVGEVLVEVVFVRGSTWARALAISLKSLLRSQRPAATKVASTGTTLRAASETGLAFEEGGETGAWAGEADEGLAGPVLAVEAGGAGDGGDAVEIEGFADEGPAGLVAIIGALGDGGVDDVDDGGDVDEAGESGVFLDLGEGGGEFFFGGEVVGCGVAGEEGDGCGGELAEGDDDGGAVAADVHGEGSAGFAGGIEHGADLFFDGFGFCPGDADEGHLDLGAALAADTHRADVEGGGVLAHEVADLEDILGDGGGSDAGFLGAVEDFGEGLFEEFLHGGGVEDGLEVGGVELGFEFVGALPADDRRGRRRGRGRRGPGACREGGEGQGEGGDAGGEDIGQGFEWRFHMRTPTYPKKWTRDARGSVGQSVTRGGGGGQRNWRGNRRDCGGLVWIRFFTTETQRHRGRTEKGIKEKRF